MEVVCLWVVVLLLNLLQIANEFESKEVATSMFSEIIQVVTVVGTISAVIVSVIKSSKNTNDKVRDAKDEILKENRNLLSSTNDKRSDLSKEHSDLSKEHSDLSKEHFDLSKEHSDIISHVTNFKNDIISIYEKEKAVEEEREKHLSPELLEMKNVTETIQKMQSTLEKLNNEVITLREENNILKIENSNLKYQIQNDKPLDLSEHNGLRK